jgi:probable rRNA maturation factor
VQADIVVCLPVVRREARAQRKTPRDHLAHLVVHGVLHAQGLDHEDEREAREMEAREVEVLRRFRIADPYR